MISSTVPSDRVHVTRPRYCNVSVRVEYVIQVVVSILGFGNDWDTGKEVKERIKIRQASRQLRESLSTFIDPRDELINPGSEAEGEGDQEGMDTHDQDVVDDIPPPDLKRRP